MGVNDVVLQLQRHTNKMQFVVVIMTPDAAEYILKCNDSGNRNHRVARIETLARDIRSDLWNLTHQGIAISEDGFLIDGQHRLQAVKESGRSIPMVVVLNVPKESMVTVDTGITRSVSDAARITGNREIGPSHVAVGRKMKQGISFSCGQVHYSNQEILEYTIEHMDAIVFAIGILPGSVRRVTSAPIRAVVARASYTQDKKRLKEFGEVLVTNFHGDREADSAAVILKNWLIRCAIRRMAGGAIYRDLAYRRTERALVSFLARERLTKLYDIDTEQFLLPEELCV